MIACARVLLNHIDQATSLAHQQPLRHITDYMIGELEVCREAAFRTRVLKLAASTRNLFELSFAAEYVCASDQQMERFILDADIDQWEIMETFESIDKKAATYQPDPKSQQLKQTIKARIDKAKPKVNGPLQTIDMAQAVYPVEFEMIKDYSKMSQHGLRRLLERLDVLGTAWLGSSRSERVALMSALCICPIILAFSQRSRLFRSTERLLRSFPATCIALVYRDRRALPPSSTIHGSSNL